MISTFILSMAIAAGPTSFGLRARGGPATASDCPVYSTPASLPLQLAQSEPATSGSGRNGRPRPRPTPLPCAVRT